MTVLHDDNSVFADLTNDAADYTRDNFAVSFTQVEDFIYVGYNKPINTIYPNMTGTLANESTMTGEYFNGSDFTSLVGFFDDSRGFSRSGFITWDRNQDDEVETTINSIELFWYRFRTADASLTFTGLNVLFCDLEDLKKEFKLIDDPTFIDVGETYILELVNARNTVMERLANTRDSCSDSYWELLRIREVRLSATYLCLTQILFNRSDAPDDIWEVKSEYYENKYEKSIARAKVSLDSNDNGIEDGIEVRPQAVRWIK